MVKGKTLIELAVYDTLQRATVIQWRVRKQKTTCMLMSCRQNVTF